jgi:hypothetical protein
MYLQELTLKLTKTQNGENQLKNEVKIMKNETKTMAKEIADPNNTNNECYKGELKMDENLINGDDSEYNDYLHSEDVTEDDIESFILSISQYDKLKPIFVAKEVRRVDIMHTLEMYWAETGDVNISCWEKKPSSEIESDASFCSSCDECKEEFEVPCQIYWISYPNRKTGNILDFTEVDDIALFDYVAEEYYGGLH